MVIHLGRLSPAASSDLPERSRVKAPRALSILARRSRIDKAAVLLGLAPGGVCRAVLVAENAVRSYRAISPLPKDRGGDIWAVYFLWHFPEDFSCRALPGAVAFVEPGLSSPSFGRRGDHPTIWPDAMVKLLRRRVKMRRDLPKGGAWKNPRDHLSETGGNVAETPRQPRQSPRHKPQKNSSDSQTPQDALETPEPPRPDPPNPIKPPPETKPRAISPAPHPPNAATETSRPDPSSATARHPNEPKCDRAESYGASECRGRARSPKRSARQENQDSRNHAPHSRSLRQWRRC